MKVSKNDISRSPAGLVSTGFARVSGTGGEATWKSPNPGLMRGFCPSDTSANDPKSSELEERGGGLVGVCVRGAVAAAAETKDLSSSVET